MLGRADGQCRCQHCATWGNEATLLKRIQRRRENRTWLKQEDEDWDDYHPWTYDRADDWYWLGSTPWGGFWDYDDPRYEWNGTEWVDTSVETSSDRQHRRWAAERTEENFEDLIANYEAFITLMETPPGS